MVNLINKSDFAQYVDIPSSIDIYKNLDKCIKEAQLFDVKVWLGDQLMKELNDQASTCPTSFSTENDFLLNGGDYEYEDDNYLLEGLKACIAYYSLARLVKSDQLKLTVGGIVKKEVEFSTLVDDKTLLRRSNDYFNNAEALKLEIIQYLNRFENDYPLWDCKKRKRKTTFKLIGQ